MYVTLNVTEGEQYTITGVDFVGDLIGQDAFIKALLPLKAGQLYNGALVTYTEEVLLSYWPVLVMPILKSVLFRPSMMTPKKWR